MCHCVLHCHPQEGPEENSAYEQLLSHLGEIPEEGWCTGLASPTLVPHPVYPTQFIENCPGEP